MASLDCVEPPLMLLFALLDANEEEEGGGLWELEAEGTAEEESLGEDEAVE